MRNAAVSLAFIALFLMTSTGLSQTIIENPAKPDNPRAGRVVTLEEVMRIEDTGKDFYIKAVYGLKAAPDGSVFVRDGQDQLLQFESANRLDVGENLTGPCPSSQQGAKARKFWYNKSIEVRDRYE
jgi:hypothetical protein